MAEAKGIEVDLVYAGRRPITGGKTGHAYYRLNLDKSLGDRHVYVDSKGGRRIIGGIYAGATYEEETKLTYGLDTMRWTGNYNRAVPDGPTIVAGWEGLDHAHEKEKEAVRAAGKYKSDLEIAMLPMRKIIRTLQKRGAHAEASGYRDLVIAELYRPLTKAEQELDDE